MKKFIALFFFLTLTTIGFTQDEWIRLETPRSGILGKPVKSIKNGELFIDLSVPSIKQVVVDTSVSYDSYQEYEEQFKTFITKYFSTKKASVLETKAYGLKIKSLNQESVGKLDIGRKYIYEGVTADSIEIVVSSKKEFEAEVSKAVKDLTGLFNQPGATELIDKVLPILDSITYQSIDSIHYRATIVNPNVYFKVKVIKLLKASNPCGCDWQEDCCLYFVDRGDQESINIAGGEYPRVREMKVDFTYENSTTRAYYPVFCGKDSKDRTFLIALTQNDSTGLQLEVRQYGGGGMSGGDGKVVAIVPYKDVDGERQWRLDRKLVDTFVYKKKIKKVFISVSARQTGESTIELINWRNDASSCRNALTVMHYPEFKAVFVTK